MKRCIVIGKPNTGKTLFVLNFARYLGARDLAISFEDAEGQMRSMSYSVEAAIKEFTGQTAHLTRSIQSVVVELPARKGRQAVEISDTTGLSEGVHSDSAIRRAMAKSLMRLGSADIILHMMDAANAFRSGRAEEIGETDREVYLLGRAQGGYCILANKMDLPGAEAGLVKIRKAFPGSSVFPISALKMEGFREVRRFVQREL